jgi:hypothetical protein
MALPSIYDWDRIRAALRQLHETFPGLLENLVLIGGGALLRAKERPQDGLHQHLLAEFLKCEFCRETENIAELNPGRWLGRARAVKSVTVPFFSNDTRLIRRLGTAIARLAGSEHKGIHHWAKHHLPGAGPPPPGLAPG